LRPGVARQWLRLRGARVPVPAGALAGGRRAAAVAAVGAAEEALRRARQRAAVIGTFAPDAWDEYRQDNPVPPPPAGGIGGMAVLIEARGRLPAELRATLLSLLDQESAEWTAHILADEEMEAHPVASLATVDSRIAFDASPPEGPVLLVDAGTVLDPQALGWLGHAAARTGAEALFCDDDRLADDPRFGRRYSEPALRGVYDADAAIVGEPPAVVLVVRGNGVAEALRRHGGGEARRLLLAAGGGVAHVPWPLASLLVPTVTTRRAPDDAATVTAPGAPPPVISAAIAVRRLCAVMPTRDEPELLEEAVTSLLDRAAEPAALRLVVVDNRSARAETAVVLDRLRRRCGIEVRAHDEPFNWSRINDVAVAGGDEAGLLFVNNDTRMLTDGWDRILARALARPEIGVVGARLVYPDGAVQHAGVTFGVGRSPVHEGMGAPSDDPGPLGRWRTTRSVAAVTGAFLAVRRDVFERVRGFDEARLAVGYNDLDLCLRVRAAGLRVLFEAGIQLVHYESRTRGQNVARSRVAWDEGELITLRRRWGDVLDLDPGYNPRWARCERAFDGLRALDEAEILAWIDRSAATDPWAIAPASG
jgi:GT2 family glycosyltransferase